MSLRDVQTKNALDFIAEAFFVNGVNPQLDDILRYMSFYFSQNTPGNPIKLDIEKLERADPEIINEAMAKTIANIDTLYETSQQQIDDMLIFNSILRTQLERLRIKRNTAEAKIDDYLLGLYNSAGYFYSVSDSFNSIELMNKRFSSAYVDTQAGVLMLSPNSDRYSDTHQGQLDTPRVTVVDSKGTKLVVETKTKFSKALDGLNNTAWFFMVETAELGPVVATLEFNITKALGATRISKIDITPYGVTPVKAAISAVFNINSTSAKERPFSSVVKQSADKMSFQADRVSEDIRKIKMVLSKDKADIVTKQNGKNLYKFIFGMKELVMSEIVYDTNGTYVSAPFSIPDDFAENAAIDSISLVAESLTPPGCEILYYVATDVSAANSVDDFDWRPIEPLSDENPDNIGAIVKFNGLSDGSVMIRREPRSQAELEILSLDSTAVDYSLRNPTSTIVTGVDVYRVAAFDYKYVPDGMELLEGVNTTKIYYTEYDTDALNFSFWKDKLNTPGSYTMEYGTTDSGHDFFYGGDIGESSKSVYVETYIDVNEEFPIVIKDFAKADQNSKIWDIALYLNGKKIGELPSGRMTVSVPWKFKTGRNHIALLANIPPASSTSPNPYIGTVRVMDDADLTDFGDVYLAKLRYVDPFKFTSQVSNNLNRFTIYNKEIVTTQTLTDNYRIKFKYKTDNGPDAIRLRIDLSRSSQFDSFSPVVDFYRLRFA